MSTVVKRANFGIGKVWSWMNSNALYLMIWGELHKFSKPQLLHLLNGDNNTEFHYGRRILRSTQHGYPVVRITNLHMGSGLWQSGVRAVAPPKPATGHMPRAVQLVSGRVGSRQSVPEPMLCTTSSPCPSCHCHLVSFKKNEISCFAKPLCCKFVSHFLDCSNFIISFLLHTYFGFVLFFFYLLKIDWHWIHSCSVYLSNISIHSYKMSIKNFFSSHRFWDVVIFIFILF